MARPEYMAADFIDAAPVRLPAIPGRGTSGPGMT